MEEYIRLSVVALIVLVPIGTSRFPFRRGFLVLSVALFVYWVLLMVIPTTVLI